MRAKDLIIAVPVLRPEDGAAELVHAFRDPSVLIVAVTTGVGEIVGAITSEDLLDALLPPYVLTTERLAGVLDEAAADTLRERIAGKRVRDFVNMTRGHPAVRSDDTLLEAATALARSRDRAVLVVEEGRVLGAITVDRLLHVLLYPESR